MMRFKSKLKATHVFTDLTPLVDVVFLMLIFFIVTSDILPLKSLNIENPTLKRDSAPMTTQLLVVMDAQNVIYVGSKKLIVDLGSLKSELEAEINHMKTQHALHTPTVVLSVDKRVDYGSFLKLLAIAQDCTPRVRLVYKNEEDSQSYF